MNINKKKTNKYKQIKNSYFKIISLYSDYDSKTLQTLITAHREDLIQLDLQGTRLSGDFSEMDFSEMDIRGVNFQGCNFTGANFRNAKLKNANLQNSTLRNADFRNTDLRNVNFQNADFRNADFRNADLSNINFQNADFRNADLRNSDMMFAKFIRTDFRGANLSGSNLIWATLPSTQLEGAIMKEARLWAANFTKAKGPFNPDDWSLDLNIIEEELYSTFNHHDNDTQESLLTAIQSIPSIDLQIKLFLQIISYFQEQQVNVFEIADPLMDVLEPFSEDHRFQSFIFEQLLPVLRERNPMRKYVCRPLLLKHLMDMNQNNSEQENYQFLARNASISSTLFTTIQSPDNNFSENLKHMAADAEKQLNELINSQIRIPGIDNLTADYDVYIAKDAQNNTVVLLIDKERSTKFYTCTLKDEFSTDALLTFYIQSPDTQEWTHTDEQLKFRPLFPKVNNRFLYLQSKKIMPNFLEGLFEKYPTLRAVFTDTLSLSSRHEAFGLPKAEAAKDLDNWVKGFVTTIHTDTFPLLAEEDISSAYGGSAADSEDATKCLENTKELFCSDLFFTTLFRNFENLVDGKSENQFFLLLSMSLVFTKLSSSHFFGSEQDSPLPVRYMATACLNSACSSIKALPEGPQKTKFKTILDKQDTWVNRLIGLKKECTCTALLSNSMNQEIDSLAVKSDAFKKILAAVVPVAWRN